MKAKSVKKEPKAAKLQRTAAARMADDDEEENAGPSQRTQRALQKQVLHTVRIKAMYCAANSPM